MSHNIDTRLIWVKGILFCIYISSLSNAALIGAVVSYWQDDVFWVLCSSKKGASQTDHLHMTIPVEFDIKNQKGYVAIIISKQGNFNTW